MSLLEPPREILTMLRESLLADDEPALVGEGGPGHGAHEDHALDYLLVREGLEDLLLGEGLAQGPTHRLDVRYHGFLFLCILAFFLFVVFLLCFGSLAMACTVG